VLTSTPLLIATTVPADEQTRTSVVERRDSVHAFARDRQLGTDQPAGDTIQQQIFGMLAHSRRDIVDLLINRLAGIEREAPVQKGPGLGRRLVYSFAIGLLQRRFTRPPPTPRPKVIALGPFRTSTL
jgi:hypothetical protein